jgi:hypothetical protein
MFLFLLQNRMNLQKVSDSGSYSIFIFFVLYRSIYIFLLILFFIFFVNGNEVIKYFVHTIFFKWNAVFL